MLFLAYANGFLAGGSIGIMKFDNFAAFINQHHEGLFDYLTLDDFRQWLNEAQQ